MREELKGLEKICAQYLKNIYAETQQLIAQLQGKTTLSLEDEKLMRKFGHQSYGSGSSYGFDFISDAGQSVTKTVHDKESIEKLLSILQNLAIQIRQAQEENHFEI